MVPYVGRVGSAISAVSYGPRMARAFRRERDTYVARLDAHEVTMLRGLVGDVRRLVAEDAPPNPMTQRLFPDPSFDPKVAADVRDLIHDDLREAKRDAARTMLETLTADGRITLDAEQAEAWLSALNDVRLALGTAIGVTEESSDEDSDDAGFQLYDWLTFLQGTLIEALSAGGVDR